MVNYANGDLFLKDSIDKQWTIDYGDDDGDVISNVDLYQQQLTLTESLCSDNTNLIFGACEASVLKIKIVNRFESLIGKTLKVSCTLNHDTDNIFELGRYKVTSDEPDSDRYYRTVTAYDAMYDIINAECASWYNSVLPDTNSTLTLRQFRDSFLSYFNITPVEIVLCNDYMTVERTIDPDSLSGKDVIQSICEINGCFGHIGRDGKFNFIVLKDISETLYPRDDLYPANDLYPMNGSEINLVERAHFRSAGYEEYETKTIGAVQIREEDDDIGAVYGDGENAYIVENNFLVYGKDAASFAVVAESLYHVIHGIHYRPLTCKCVGNPCLEVGDPIRLNTNREILYSYILERTLTGLQALSDTYKAEGEETYSEDVNGVNTSITQLKGKTNVLVRTVEETISTLKDLETNTQSQIKQTADQISAEVTRATNSENELKSQITLTAESLTSEITQTQNNLSSKITQNAEEISTKVEKNGVISAINQSAESIQLDANRINFTVGNNEYSLSLLRDGMRFYHDGDKVGQILYADVAGDEGVTLEGKHSLTISTKRLYVGTYLDDMTVTEVPLKNKIKRLMYDYDDDDFTWKYKTANFINGLLVTDFSDD